MCGGPRACHDKPADCFRLDPSELSYSVLSVGPDRNVSCIDRGRPGMLKRFAKNRTRGGSRNAVLRSIGARARIVAKLWQKITAPQKLAKTQRHRANSRVNRSTMEITRLTIAIFVGLVAAISVFATGQSVLVAFLVYAGAGAGALVLTALLIVLGCILRQDYADRQAKRLNDRLGDF